jgi:hypothetical protein
MKYMMLIYDDAAFWKRATDAQMAKTMQSHNELAADLRSGGKFHGCEALQPSGTAACLRRKNGKTLVTDGPYAETKEQLGGYYLIEARDLDEALEYARRLPLSDPGTVEIRPVRVFY